MTKRLAQVGQNNMSRDKHLKGALVSVLTKAVKNVSRHVTQGPAAIEEKMVVRILPLSARQSPLFTIFYPSSLFTLAPIFNRLFCSGTVCKRTLLARAFASKAHSTSHNAMTILIQAPGSSLLPGLRRHAQNIKHLKATSNKRWQSTTTRPKTTFTSAEVDEVIFSCVGNSVTIPDREPPVFRKAGPKRVEDFEWLQDSDDDNNFVSSSSSLNQRTPGRYDWRKRATSRIPGQMTTDEEASRHKKRIKLSDTEFHPGSPYYHQILNYSRRYAFPPSVVHTFTDNITGSVGCLTLRKPKMKQL